MKEITSSILSEDIAEALLKGYANANPDKVLDSKEFSKILKWAEEVELSKALLSGIISGDILPSVNEKGEVVFSVSERGLKSANILDVMSMKLPNAENIQ
jgi:hypothetical protein